MLIVIDAIHARGWSVTCDVEGGSEAYKIEVDVVKWM